MCDSFGSRRGLTFGLVLCLLLLGVGGIAPAREEGPEARESRGGAPALRDMTTEEVDSLLEHVAENVPLLEDRLRILSLLTLGTPYANGCLGEEKEPDPDPVFRLDRTDCTVQVLVLASLLHSRSLVEAARNMSLANYREIDGRRPVTFENRLHFSFDRLDSSPYYENVTENVVPGELLATAEVVLNRKQDGDRLLPLEWERPVTVHYLPSIHVSETLLETLPPGLGVVLVKEENFPLGVVAGHEGVLFGREFIHASQIEREVVREPSFLEYLFPNGPDGRPRFTGVVFYRFR